MEQAISTFEKLPLPTIAAINGPALGAGFVLSLACDLRVGTSKAKMGIPVGRLGITLNQMFVKRIADLIGGSRTMDLVYTGRLLDASECCQLGLVNYMVPDDEDVDHFTLRLAKKLWSSHRRLFLLLKDLSPTISRHFHFRGIQVRRPVLTQMIFLKVFVPL